MQVKVWRIVMSLSGSPSERVNLSMVIGLSTKSK